MKLPKIFVTVGSTHFKFDRLLQSIDQTLIKEKDDNYVIAQIGQSNHRWNYKKIRLINYLHPNTMISHIKKADKIISHGGPISIYQITKYGKNLPLIIPRLAKFNEHVDNHQLYFTDFQRKQLSTNLRKYFAIDENIEKYIENYLKEKPKKNILNKYLFLDSGKTNVIQNLDKFIQKPNK